MEKQTLATVASATATGDEPGILITTSALDRQNDELVPEGCDYTAYLRNPVVLYAHQHAALPVGTTTQLAVTPGRAIEARWKWLRGDAFADRVRNAFEQGALRGASVGFVPKQSEQNRQGGRKYLRWELVEWSLCPVPANPQAVRLLKELALWPDDAIVLELDDGDDDVLDGVSDEVFRQAWREGVSDAARVVLDSAVRQAVRHALHVGEPFRDPSARHRSDDLDRDAVRRAMATAVPGMVREIVAEAVASAFARARGRVD